MLFSSITFLYFFLPVFILCYSLVPFRWKNAVLLFFSLAFYFWGEPVYTFLMLAIAGSNFVFGKMIGKSKGNPAAKGWVAASVLVSLLTLGFFKYADFFIQTVNGVLGTRFAPLHIPLPLGISFYVFQTLSYTIDLYRGDAPAQNSLISYAAYVTMFPQLVAGPIVRYSSVARALEHRSCTSGDVARGVFRFTVGLAKKVLIANQLGELNKIAQASVEGSVLMAWLAAISFALQIYFDFSGYSDMALGLGRAMGFDFPENFNYPFISASVTEFWRRWHISLGTWFREYLYIPLGGNRVSRLKWLRNILIVWFCTGLWHGASWNYVVWGLYFGVLLVMEKTLYAGALRRAWAPVRYGYMFFVISIGFVIFENESLAQGIAQVGHMFGMGAASLAGAESLYYLRSFAVLLIAAAVGATPLVRGLTVRLKERLPRLAGGLEPVAAGLLLFLSTAYLVDSSFNPFLYFRF